VNSGNNDDRDADYEFERKWIDDCDLSGGGSLVWGNGEMLDGGVQGVKPGNSTEGSCLDS